MGKYRNTDIHPKHVLFFALLLLSTGLVQMGLTEQASDMSLSSTVCNALSERHECVWTGCVRSDWSSGAHGCGTESILCGNPDSCPGGWQYRCCDIGAELNVMLSSAGRSIGKRSSAAPNSSGTATTRQLALLKRIINNRKTFQRSSKKPLQQQNKPADGAVISQAVNPDNSMGNDVFPTDLDLEYDK